MKRLVTTLTALATITTGCGNKVVHDSPIAPTTTEKIKSVALQAIEALKAKGAPIEDVYEFTAETDDNQDLGKPGEYIARVAWHDSRLTRDEDDKLASTLNGGSIEVFSNKTDLEVRQRHLEIGTIFTDPGEHSCVLDGLKLVRVSGRLTDDQAKDYCR